MAYRLRSTESVQDGLRRIAVEQIGKALEDAVSPDREAAVHRARTRCKKLRSLIRLVRPAFGDYAQENADFRDAARDLAGARDAAVMVRTCEALAAWFTDPEDAAALAPVRRLLLRRQGAAAADDTDARLAAFAARMEAARARASHYRIEGRGYAVVRGGLAHTFHRARRAGGKARRHPGDSLRLHAWRGEVKHHWHHMRLLRDVWPEMIGVHRTTARTAAERLGDEHDLAVLRQTLVADGARAVRLEAAIALIDQRRAALAAQALSLGALLFAEETDHFAARVGGYWRAWRTGAAPAATP